MTNQRFFDEGRLAFQSGEGGCLPAAFDGPQRKEFMNLEYNVWHVPGSSEDEGEREVSRIEGRWALKSNQADVTRVRRLVTEIVKELGWDKFDDQNLLDRVSELANLEDEESPRKTGYGDHIRLVVDEALIDAMKFGNRGNEEKPLVVEVQADRTKFQVRVGDMGGRFRHSLPPMNEYDEADRGRRYRLFNSYCSSWGISQPTDDFFRESGAMSQLSIEVDKPMLARDHMGVTIRQIKKLKGEGRD